MKEAPNDSVRAELYRNLYDYYQYTQPDSALHYINEGLAYFKKAEYSAGVARLTALHGQLESLQGRQEMAKLKFGEALKIYKEIKDINGVAMVNNSLGVIEGRTGRYLSATKYFLTALHEYEKIGNTKGIINTYLKLGTVNDINNNLDKAAEYFNKGLQLSLKYPGNRNTAYLYNSLGVVYCKKGMPDTGLVLFQKAIDLSQSPEMLETRIHSVMHMGNAYKDKGEYNRSLEYYTRALKEADEENMPENHARLLLNIATIKGMTDRKQAFGLLAKAEAIAKEIEQRALYLEVQEEKITQYQQMGDYKAAFNVMKSIRHLQDSLFSIEKNTEIANLQSVHELQQSNEKVHQLEVSDKRSTEQRNIIFAIAGVLLLTLVALTLTYSKTNRLNKEMAKREAELQRSNTIKDRIFSVIGHDLRGPIANIPMVIELYKDPRTTEEEKIFMHDLLTENSMASLEILDKLLSWGKSQIKGTSIQQKQFRASHSLQHQLSLIKGMAANKGINIKNNVPDSTVLFADEEHFNFVIRNLVSNAIKFSHRDSKVTIDADQYTRSGYTIFSVKDEGVGIPAEQQSKIFEAFGSSTLGTNNEGGTSIGLMLCKEFITQNGGEIWVESEEGKGSTFYFSLKNV